MTLALCACSCCPLIACRDNSSPGSVDSDYDIEVALIGECASLQNREFRVNSKVQTRVVPDPEDTQTYGAELCEVQHFVLCTPDEAAFLEAPLEVVVLEAGAVVAEQSVERPGCQYAPVDGNSEYITLFVEADGSVRTDFGVHPLVTIQCEEGNPVDCQGRDDLAPP